jgi:hypothetical protein
MVAASAREGGVAVTTYATRVVPIEITGDDCAYCGRSLPLSVAAGERCCSAEHALLLRIVGEPEREQNTPEPPTRAEVRRLRRAMAEATTWGDLLALAQRIWNCPLVEDGGAPASARSRLCNAYAQAVDRMWRRGARRGSRSRRARTHRVAA